MESQEPPPSNQPIQIPLSKPIVIGGPTLRSQWILIAVFGAITSACLTVDVLAFPKDFEQGNRTPLTWVAGIVTAIGHGLWITMDRNRRGREIGWWRFGAIFLGPVAISLYLMHEYGLRALYLIPALAGIYVAIIAIPIAALLVATPAI